MGDYDISKIIIRSPKKHGDYLISKVKYMDYGITSDIILQFPKMKLNSDYSDYPENSKCSECSENLEHSGTDTTDNTNDNTEQNNNTDTTITDTTDNTDNTDNTESKKINRIMELEFLNTNSGYNKKIYNFLLNTEAFIIDKIYEKSQEWFNKKIPLENIKNMYTSFIKAPRSTQSNCTLNFSIKGSKTYKLFTNKDNEIELSDFFTGAQVETIARMKYLIFSKEKCYVLWELCSAKLHKKINRVQKYGFVEDPLDQEVEVESESEDEGSYSFF